MSLSEKQMKHPRFFGFNNTATALLEDAFKKHGMDPKALYAMEVHAGRVVDSIVALLLRADKDAGREL